MIREAVNGADVSNVVKMVKALTASVSGPQQVDDAHTGAQVARLIQSETGVVFISKAGFIAGELSGTIINPELVACEHGWFASDRSGMRLLIAFERWAESHGARIKMSTQPEGSVAAKILEQRGYRPVELAWIK